jgi:alpha,alpha-trehalose phosphorylase
MMGLPRPAAVVCDLDGTLVDTVPTRITAWLRTFEEFGLPADRGHVASLIGSDGKWLAEQVAARAARASRALSPAELEAIDRRAGEIYGELNTAPRPPPGVAAFLAALNWAGVKWAIATSSRLAQVGVSVAALGLAQPPVIVDGQAVSRAKPEPDLLLAAAAALGTAPDGCWCVGDSRWDVQAAIAARMVPVGVTTGSATAEELRADGALAVVDRLDRLVGAL